LDISLICSCAEPTVLVGFGLIDDGHVAVFLKLLQMDANQAPQLLFGGCRLTDRIPEPFENLAGLVLVELNQNIVFVLEVEINGSIRHTGLFGNLGNCRLKKPLFGKYADAASRIRWYLSIFFFFVAMANLPTTVYE
jgi:hypothetical protein